MEEKNQYCPMVLIGFGYISKSDDQSAIYTLTEPSTNPQAISLSFLPFVIFFHTVIIW